MAEISDGTYEELRRILEKQNGRSYTLEEVKEIGDGLLEFYNLLIEIFTKDSTQKPTRDQ